jgi:AraC-like DNA-binding protein
MDQIRISSVMPIRLEEQGIALAEVMRLAGLPASLFQTGRTIFSTVQWFAFWKVLAEAGRNPLVGLRLSLDAHFEPYNPIILSALSAGSYRAALKNVSRYLRLYCSTDLDEHEQNSHVSYEPAWPNSQECSPPALVDSIFTSLLEMGRRGTRKPLAPERVVLTRLPAHRPALEAHFGCPVEFGAPRNRLVFNRQTIEQPFACHNPELLAQVIPRLEEALLDDLRYQSVSEQVKGLFRSRLSMQNPSIQSVSGDLCLSPRTLQRRLASEGTSFRQVVDSVRREIAAHYLRASTLEIKEIAFLLGYEEASSFNRAFVAWEGMSPGLWRQTVGRPDSP